MDSALVQTARRPRRRPPLKSYIPFFVFATGCLVVLVALVWLVAHLFVLVDHHSSAAPLNTATAVPGLTSGATHVVVQILPSATAADIGSMLAGGSAQPTPSFTPAPTPVRDIAVSSPTPTSAVKLVIARDVNGETPTHVSTRFLSPALRLWAVATVKNVSAIDVLRFVFQRNGMTLPHDDISVVAGTAMGKHSFLAVQSFKVWADYEHGAKPLPSGNYRLVFYKNGHLEGQTAFRVG